MSNVVLSVENLYKQYRLGTVGTGTMRDDLARFWAKLRGKEDPNLKIGEVNDRNTITGEYVWALQDINFEVKQGEVLGIIGKNGAGKSTLLKILSKVTSPTKGQIKTKGRIASLLEVGTGFHPELTGRENIFLNGAILGMTKNDIRSKFDEIVEFSGIGKYIDTPVKRYSSGMYVRLAFAVAAHLEPEILIIDEVLAVGDAEFQKKCLGKMKDVSGEGRTVLFVSHDMRAVRNLCTECVLMKNGGVEFIGNTKVVIEDYLTKKMDFKNEIPHEYSSYNTGEAKFKYIDLLDTTNNSVIEVLYKQPLHLKLDIEVFKEIKNPILDIKINTPDITFITYSMETKLLSLDPGTYTINTEIDNQLIPGNYAFTLGVHKSDGATIDYVENIYPFTISDFSKDKTQDYPYQWKHGFIVADSNWSINKTKKEIIA